MRVVHIVETPGAGRLGRHIEHDARSKTYETTAHQSPLQTQAWQRYVPPFDQGDLGSCTGNALAGCLATGPHYQPSRVVDEDLAVRIYSAGTSLDAIPGHYPPDDTGSSGLAVCKAAVKMGLIHSYHHAFSLHSALAALSNVGPIIIGVNWYSGFDSPTGPGALLEIAGDVRGGHEMQVLAIDVERQLVRGANSWGDSWGDEGYFTMSFTTFARLLAEHGDATIPLAA